MFYPPWIITPVHREPQEPIVLIWKGIFLSTQSISLFGNTMGNPFFDFFKYWPKRSNFLKKNSNMDILIWFLLSESIFDFGKWSHWKYANTRFCVFLVSPLPKVKNWFWKHISNENVHISDLKKKLERFGQYLKKLKIRFPIVFPKSEIDRVDRNIHIQISTMGSWGSQCIGVLIQGGKNLGFLFFPFMPRVYYKWCYWCTQFFWKLFYNFSRYVIFCNRFVCLYLW